MDPYNGYMAETSEAHFWALELAPQKKETFTVNPDHVLHLTMASFGTQLAEKDRAPISMQVKTETPELQEATDAKKVTNCTLCVLLPGVMESIPLNVILSESTSVTFTNNSKSNTVYLTGYMTLEDAFGNYEGSSDEEFDEEEDSEEDSDEEEQNIPVKKQDDKAQKQGNIAKGAKQTPSLPQKKQVNREEEDSDEDDISMEEDLSDDFDMGEDSEEDEEEESDEEELQPKAANQKAAKVGQKRNEPSVNVAKSNKKPNTPQMTSQQSNQKKQNNVLQNTQKAAPTGNQTTPNSQQKLTPSQKKRLRKKRKKMEEKSKTEGSS
ncbi:hypothetical protein GpartN1_g3462.t1 [Galdieria partita]|uniref:Nucleoplasmin-like domain-containing protein n=1 Tax=Galdieria partita TaxID=83374 RepID=A0A9C7PXH9_9RHOD|nr:hypothetical protein GpartN1_g3462.t1 [Galdieria partita]